MSKQIEYKYQNWFDTSRNAQLILRNKSYGLEVQVVKNNRGCIGVYKTAEEVADMVFSDFIPSHTDWRELSREQKRKNIQKDLKSDIQKLEAELEQKKFIHKALSRKKFFFKTNDDE